MESAPANLDVDAIRAALVAEPDVLSVHDLHVWVLTPGEVAMSGHVVSERPDSALLVRLCALLRDRYGIGHATLQLEPPGFDEAEMHP
jgi:cobalt-zinc-cadmium efflux system protein